MSDSTDKPAVPRHCVIVLDDHPMVRERLSELLNREPDLVVCGEAEDRIAAPQFIGHTKPQIAIVDLTLKRSHGLDLIKNIQTLPYLVRVLVVSMQDEAMYAERLIRAGAPGYITKQETTRSVLQGSWRVLAGESIWARRWPPKSLQRRSGVRRLPTVVPLKYSLIVNSRCSNRSVPD